MKKELEEECVKQHIDMLKQTINTRRTMIKKKESPFLVYDDANNLYGFAMWKKLPIGHFVWIEKDDISEFDVEYPINICVIHSDLAFLPERMEINKCTKLVCNTQNKENYVVHIAALKQTLNHGLKLTKVHRIAQFDQEDWLNDILIWILN